MKQLTELEQAEVKIGKRPQTQFTDRVACLQCHRIYQEMPDNTSLCPKCLAEGHGYRLKSLDESKWWIEYYKWRIKNRMGLDFLNETWLEINIKLVETLEKQ